MTPQPPLPTTTTTTTATTSPATGALAFVRSLDVATLQRLVVVGFGMRLLLWALSSGSGDIRTWSRIGSEVATAGLRRLYGAGPPFRQSPVAAVWAGCAAELSTFLEAPFELVFKLLPLGADVAVLGLVLRTVRRRGGTDLDAWRAGAILATALGPIWVTSHHGGLESVLIAAALAAVILVDEGDRPVLAGIAMACAIHMHVIAVVLLPALWIAQARTARQAGLFGVGLGVALLPLALPLSLKGVAFITKALVITTSSNRWGLQFLFSEGGEWPILGPWIDVVAAEVQAVSWKVALLASLALGVRARLLQRSVLELGALVIAAFLVVTPRFGVQYAALPIAFLVVVDLRRALQYSAASGLYLTVAYLGFGKAEMPLVTNHSAAISFQAGVLAFISWLVLVAFLRDRLRPTPAPASPEPTTTAWAEGRRRAVVPVVFAAVALPFGAAFALATPPFQVADEPLHAFTACALAAGQLTPGHDAPEPWTTTLDVPADLVLLNRAVATMKLPHKPGTKVALPALLDAARLPHDPALTHISTREETREMSVYPPVMYGPQAVACAVGRALELRPFSLLAAMRLTNLAAFILLGALALWFLPVGRDVVAMLLVSPMALSSAASASADGQMIPFIALWLALVLHLAHVQGPALRWWQVAGLSVMAFLVAMAKTVYLPLALAVVCLPGHRYRSVGHRVVAVVVILSCGVVGGLAWIPQAGGGLDAYAATLKLDPKTSLDAAIDSPFMFVLAALRTLFRERILTGIVGTLGWRDTVLPFSAVASFWATAIPLAFVGGTRTSRPFRGVILGVAGAGAACGLLLFYALYFTKPGAPYVLNVQGRHLLPPLLFFGVALGEFLGVGLSDRARRVVVVIVAVVSTFILVKALGAVETRYYRDPRDVAIVMKAASALPAITPKTTASPRPTTTSAPPSVPPPPAVPAAPDADTDDGDIPVGGEPSR